MRQLLNLLVISLFLLGPYTNAMSSLSVYGNNVKNHYFIGFILDNSNFLAPQKLSNISLHQLNSKLIFSVRSLYGSAPFYLPVFGETAHALDN